jgi:hypothetical protein
MPKKWTISFAIGFEEAYKAAKWRPIMVANSWNHTHLQHLNSLFSKAYSCLATNSPFLVLSSWIFATDPDTKNPN